MKIAFIIPHYYPSVSFGGPPIVVHQLAVSLVKQHAEVSVFSGDAFDSRHRIAERNTRIENVSVRYFKEASTHLAYGNNLYLTPGFFQFFLRQIKNFDLIHIHEIYTIQNLYTAFLASKFNKPFVISPHGSLTNSSMRGKRTIKKIFFGITKNVYSQASGVIALTDKEKKECINWGVCKKKISIIPNGINLPEHVLSRDRKRFQNKWKIPKSAKIILFIGRLHPIKHLDLLLESVREAKKKDDTIFLIIAGPDAGIKKELEYLANHILPLNSYLFMDTVRGSDKSIILTEAKISVLTSYSEGLSQFALESASYGVPLITTRSSGQDFVTKFRCGWEVPENSYDISEHITKLLSDKERYDQFSNNGRTAVMKHYSWKIAADQHIELYESIIKSSRM